MFVVFFSAQRAFDKIKKLCESMSATLYPYNIDNPQVPTSSPCWILMMGCVATRFDVGWGKGVFWLAPQLGNPVRYQKMVFQKLCEKCEITKGNFGKPMKPMKAPLEISFLGVVWFHF